MTEPIELNPAGNSVYEQLGGDPIFQHLVDIFYARVEADPLLRPMFPDDLEPGKEYQFLFLTQYWGGPARYQVERGHPRLRMRHAPFPIDQEARDAWFNHMVAAIDEVGIPEPVRSQMVDYFARGATFMINQAD
ncbi:MAG: globin [Chloroflexi bacterium]|nr:globin [Chloroflexota bacterium]